MLMVNYIFSSRKEPVNYFTSQLLSNYIFRIFSLKTVSILALQNETTLNIIDHIYSLVIFCKYIL